MLAYINVYTVKPLEFVDASWVAPPSQKKQKKKQQPQNEFTSSSETSLLGFLIEPVNHASIKLHPYELAKTHQSTKFGPHKKIL